MRRYAGRIYGKNNVKYSKVKRGCIEISKQINKDVYSFQHMTRLQASNDITS